MDLSSAQHRCPDSKRVCRRVAVIDDIGKSLIKSALSYLQVCVQSQSPLSELLTYFLILWLEFACHSYGQPSTTADNRHWKKVDIWHFDKNKVKVLSTLDPKHSLFIILNCHFQVPSVKEDDLENTFRYLNLLRGEPLLVAQDWLQDLGLHLEVV